VEVNDPSYRGQLGEGAEGPRGRGRGGSSLEVAGKRRLWRKGSRKGVDAGAQRVNALLSHLSLLVSVIVNLIAVNQIESPPY
jgi:hypothetical protein